MFCVVTLCVIGFVNIDLVVSDIDIVGGVVENTSSVSFVVSSSSTSGSFFIYRHHLPIIKLKVYLFYVGIIANNHQRAFV